MAKTERIRCNWAILKKRAGYQRAFERFLVKRVAKYDAKKRAALLREAGIVHHIP